MSEADSGSLPDDEWEFIAARKKLQYAYAEPYLKPHPRPEAETEGEFRSRIRDAVTDLPLQDRLELRTETAKLRKDILGENYEFSTSTPTNSDT